MTLQEYGKKIKHLEGLTNLQEVWDRIAHDMEVSPPLVKLWAYGVRKVTPTRVLELEKVTDGEVKRWSMRPDLYPPQDYKPNTSQL